ncbi:hypothetical protein B0H16DRAFT_1478340 [Mycena metata]|uniref:Uncharacterized protein n=1 Tax=Mycena metata TaxID=1033252 RepID=A0AAD7H6U3_9AGAR|nr:hypothetical protein B0H16DRAFT_1478340 [Mycena metata]
MPSSFIIALNKAIDRPSNVSEAELAAIEVEDDLDAEENALAPSANDGVIDTDGGTDIATLVKDRVLNADHIRDVAQSANVQTSAGYKRLGRNFQAFLAETNEIKAGDPVFTAHPREDMPELIAAWIMNSCDQIAIDGVHLPPGAIRLSFANAQKMRAAASWNFGQVENQGNVPWRKSDSTTVKPSVFSLRKNHQYVQIEPFYLFLLAEEQAHRPVRAFCGWIATSGVDKGPLFPKMTIGRIWTDTRSSAEFSQIFPNHLIDIGVDRYPSGNSFRRE